MISLVENDQPPMLSDSDIVFKSSQNSEDLKFDIIVGEIEEMLMEQNFLNLQKKFFEANYQKFDSGDENKNRPDELEGDVFDVLNSLGDFSLFKETILAFKQNAEGTNIDLSDLLCISSEKK
ncbi:ADP-ribosylation factor-like protein 2-binding protein [Clydaea vesicula]|uniref:ADP-ribosylation factor-like protein 2-binding protein n=1 Tax=Clydaea vesicula TaxID=447962 RepID=A0AAD5XYG1_9FUNG|nr:ADP-ribosylation factor-like protein 2-binding protein [Clydaea vesicula]